MACLLSAAALLSAADLDVPTADCASGVYRVIADDTLRCTEVDRVEVLLAQRNFHERAQQVYKLQAEVLRLKAEADALARIMTEAQNAARERCRANGREFDVMTVECGAALPAKKEEKR